MADSIEMKIKFHILSKQIFISSARSSNVTPYLLY
jgi:hypothetical protein